MKIQQWCAGGGDSQEKGIELQKVEIPKETSFKFLGSAV